MPAVTPEFVAAGTAVANNTTTLTISWPAGHKVGDIGILTVCDTNEAKSLTIPSGFVEITNSPQGTGTAGTGTSVGIAKYWARADQTLMNNNGGVMPDVVVAFNTGFHIGQILTYRHCLESGNPWEAPTGDVDAVGGTAVTIPTTTTTVANCLIEVTCGGATDTAGPEGSGYTNANLTGISERADSWDISGNGGGFVVATGLKVTAGAVGTTTATLVTSSKQARFVLALKPAVAPVCYGTGHQEDWSNAHPENLGTLTWPTHDVDDIGILMVESENDRTIGFTTTAGFVPITGGNIGIRTDKPLSTQLSLFWCRATSSSQTVPVILQDDDVNDPNQRHYLAQIVTFRGCIATGDPFHVVNSDTQDLTTTNFQVPGGITSYNNCAILAITTSSEDLAVNATSNWYNAHLACLREVSNAATSFGKGGCVAAAAGVKVAGGIFNATSGQWAFASSINGQAQARISLAILALGTTVIASASPAGLPVAGGVGRGSLSNTHVSGGWIRPGGAHRGR